MTFETPTALEYFATLVADDASLSLVEAAAAIAQDEFPQLDTQAVLAEIDALAVRLKKRFPVDAVPVQRLRWLNRFFFQELGFAGNVNDYYDPHNSYLHQVLATRRGIPITLAILYMELATQIGLTARGVSFPGHFLVKLRMNTGQQQGEVVIDPFTGQSLSREELDELLAPGTNAAAGCATTSTCRWACSCRPPAPRDIVARMLRNLKEIHRSGADWPRLLPVLRPPGRAGAAGLGHLARAITRRPGAPGRGRLRLAPVPGAHARRRGRRRAASAASWSRSDSRPPARPPRLH